MLQRIFQVCKKLVRDYLKIPKLKQREGSKLFEREQVWKNREERR